MVSDVAWPCSGQSPWGTAPATGPVGWLGRPSASDRWGVGCFLSLGRPTCAPVCGVLGHLALVHRCARWVRGAACAVTLATWLLFTGVPARCVVLRVRCPGPLGSCSPVCPRGVLCRVCGVLGDLVVFTGAPARCVALLVRCPGPLGSCSTVCPLDVLCGVCGVLGHLAPVHRCARSVCCLACAVSRATWLVFTGVPARCVVSRVRCLGALGRVHRCARSVRCFACAVSWASWLLFNDVPARCVVWRVRRPGPLASCSPVRPRGVLCRVCGVLGHLAAVNRCARSVCCFACAVSWASWLLFTGVPARCVVFQCGVLGHLAPVHRCACLVCCVVCALSRATWLLFTGVPARCVVLRARCPGPLGSCSPMCPRGVLCRVCGDQGHLAPVHRCARSVRCFACAVSWATWLLFTAVPARCVVLRVRSPWPLGSCSAVSALRALLCVCGVLGHLARVHRCARSVCCIACAMSWATWLLFTGAPARCVVLRVRCLWPFGSCSPVCPLGALLCVCGVLGHLAPVHRCYHMNP